MTVSIFDLFSIGVGPSSSHTVGPMAAAYRFSSELDVQRCVKVKAELYGSLAWTGEGHGTNKAVLMGLCGEQPHLVDPDSIEERVATIEKEQRLKLGGQTEVAVELILNTKEELPCHTNGMQFTAMDQQNNVIAERIFYSVGGGFIVSAEEFGETSQLESDPLPYPFHTAKALENHCRNNQLTIAEVMLANEKTWADEAQVKNKLMEIAKVMRDCIDKGCQTTGILPGGLNLPRRASKVYQQLHAQGKPQTYEHTTSMDWLNAYALAVNEENAAGGRIVTAPTNGAAGIIPAVMWYYRDFYPQAKDEDLVTFLLTAGAIAILYKEQASISGAEVGCQGEVGVASSMAAAALCAVSGGSLKQITNAAEIAMEHHLGMTCDPIKGLVQIPCIERNAMGSVKAVNAVRLALMGTGEHYVSLDKVITTMHQTGKDMMSIYKETSLGGLAVNHPEC